MVKMKCKNCGYDIFPGNKFCGNCGSPVDLSEDQDIKKNRDKEETKVCSVCGTPIKEGYVFCKNCRTPVSGETGNTTKNGAWNSKKRTDDIPNFTPPPERAEGFNNSSTKKFTNGTSGYSENSASGGTNTYKSHISAPALIGIGFGMVFLIVIFVIVYGRAQEKAAEEAAMYEEMASQDYDDDYYEDSYSPYGQYAYDNDGYSEYDKYVYDNEYGYSEGDIQGDDSEEYSDSPVSEYELVEQDDDAVYEEESEYSGAEGYILPESNSRYISESELANLNEETCRIARNEIYARHGRKFKDEELQNYFNQFEWYSPTIEPDNFPESLLNQYEKENRDLIMEYERKQGWNE